jgi:hypothetical protein
MVAAKRLVGLRARAGKLQSDNVHATQQLQANGCIEILMHNADYLMTGKRADFT